MKVEGATLEAIQLFALRLAPRGYAGQPLICRQIQKQRQIGTVGADHQRLQLAEQLIRTSTRVGALISASRIRKTIADHPPAGSEGRPYGDGEMIRARRVEQQ